MLPQIELLDQLVATADTIVLVKDASTAKQFSSQPGEINYLNRQIEDGSRIISINQYERQLYFVLPEEKKSVAARKEALRKTGFELFKQVSTAKISTLQITSFLEDPSDILAFCEGLALSSYEFLKYKSEKKANRLERIQLQSSGLTKEAVQELATIIEAVFIARDLVNEPVIYLTAEQLSQEFSQLGEHAGFEVEVFGKTKIQSLKMGGLLAVNFGSPNPPTFTTMLYKPDNAVNSQPYILVGKGVVYDTGGLSLKPTPNSMDCMKSDMAGAAAVGATLFALAKNNVPLYVIGLVPATENRPDGNAITPGDVITMHSGKTVEVLNTDAEGRLILADALSYAKKYNPALVIDLATLTGSAARAIGKEGIVFMGTASEEEKKEFVASSFAVYERLVEFPLWDEYDSQLESTIADLKNLGGADAGAITAGKFLEHFTSYPWLHLDIAASAFLTAPDNYRGKNGTGVGVRLLYQFLKEKATQR
jgi:leucyl aminopeptidase